MRKIQTIIKGEKKMRKLILITVLALVFCATAVMADPGPYDPTMSVDGYDTTPDAVLTPNENDDPAIYEAINHLLGTSLLSNEDTDSYQVLSQNAFWYDLGGGEASNDFAAIGIAASNNNTLYVYDSLFPATDIQVLPTITGVGLLGNGTYSDPYPGGVNPFTGGENFGFRLYSEKFGNTKIWDSLASSNEDGLDHMLAFHLPSLAGSSVWVDVGGAEPVEMFLTSDTYLLAFEDRVIWHQNYDGDYNDTMFLVTRIRPVPEPMSLMLLGSGLAVLFGRRRRVS